MATQEQLHTVDTFWDLVFAPENDDKRIHLIDGEAFRVSTGPLRFAGPACDILAALCL